MILLTAVAAQVVAPGASVVFDAEQFGRRRGRGVCLGGGVHVISFGANVAGTVPVELTVYVGGEPLPEAVMVSNVATEQSVSATTAVKSCGCERVTVVNTGAAAVTVTNARLLIDGDR